MAKDLLNSAVLSTQIEEPSTFSLEINDHSTVNTKIIRENQPISTPNQSFSSIQRVFYVKPSPSISKSPISSPSRYDQNSIEKEFLKSTSTSNINSYYSPSSTRKSHTYLDPFQDEFSLPNNPSSASVSSSIPPQNLSIVPPFSNSSLSHGRYPVTSPSPSLSTPLTSLSSSQIFPSKKIPQPYPQSSYPSHHSHQNSNSKSQLHPPHISSSYSTNTYTTSSTNSYPSPKMIRHIPEAVTTQYNSLELEDLSDSIEFHNNINLEDIMNMDFN